ncbi:Alpha-amylase OS=Streptomyces fumanus OX=67302 GN=GCM10018772_00600 PE=3 SV=1 [Streptomyces fumanus]
MLAWPYRVAWDINSGYEFLRPRRRAAERRGGERAGRQNGWKCQHAWPEIKSMVAFRNAVRGEAVTNWWDNGGESIAFGRGGKGFVAINHESGSLTRTYQTSLAAGTYCDVQSRPGRSP